jgi:hypothetical protein
MNPDTAVAVVFIMLIGAGVLIVFTGMRHRTKILEMAHRERLAMIERGLVPPAELTASVYEETRVRRSARSSKLLSAGIVIVGLGLGLAMLIGFASGQPEIAAGVGGAVVILGVAMIVTAVVVRPSPEEDVSASVSRPGVDRKSFPSDPSV